MGNVVYVRGDQIYEDMDDEEDDEEEMYEEDEEEINLLKEAENKEPIVLEEIEVDYLDIAPPEYNEDLRRCGHSVSCLDEEKGICVVFAGWKYPNPGKRLNDIVIISGLNDNCQNIHFKKITDNFETHIPAPRNLHKTIVVKMEEKYRIYVFCGFSGRNCIDDFCYFELTPTENDFIASPWKLIMNKNAGPRPTERAGQSFDLVGKKFYMFGGVKNYYGATNELWTFDYETEEWKLEETFGEQKPPARMYHSTAVVGETIVLVGGANSFNGAKFFSDIWLLHLSKDKYHHWQKLTYDPPNHIPFAIHSMASLGTQLVVFGGPSPHLCQEEINEPYLVDLTYTDRIKFKKIVVRKPEEEKKEEINLSSSFEINLSSSLTSLNSSSGKKEEVVDNKKVPKRIPLENCYYWMPGLFYKGDLITFFGSYDWNTFVHVDGAVKKFVFNKTVPSLKEICIRKANQLYKNDFPSIQKYLPEELYKLIVNYYPYTTKITQKLF